MVCVRKSTGHAMGPITTASWTQTTPRGGRRQLDRYLPPLPFPPRVCVCVASQFTEAQQRKQQQAAQVAQPSAQPPAQEVSPAMVSVAPPNTAIVCGAGTPASSRLEFFLACSTRHLGNRIFYRYIEI